MRVASGSSLEVLRRVDKVAMVIRMGGGMNKGCQ